MKKVIYIGLKPQKSDNVSDTKLVWHRGQVHEIHDEAKAEKLLSYPDIWADADKPYKLMEAGESRAPAPKVTITVPGAKFELDQSAENLSAIARGELIAVFMTPADAKAFDEWKQLESETAPGKSDGLQPKVMKKNAQAPQSAQATL